MQLETKTIRKSLNKAFLRETINRDDFDNAVINLNTLLNKIDQAKKADESEEHHKFFLPSFFKGIGFDENYINTDGRTDLAIHNGSKKRDPVGVMIETKKPGSKEMITEESPNRKAMHEAVLYYLRERIEKGNTDDKHVILTDLEEWFIFDAQEFDRHFIRNGPLKKEFKKWSADQKSNSNTSLMYNLIADYLEDYEKSIRVTHFSFNKYRSNLSKDNRSDDEERKLIPLVKLLSPVHLLKQSFANDSNSLDRRFYNELLYIIGLEEKDKGSAKLIGRLKEDDRISGSLIENTIRTLKYEDRLRHVNEPDVTYGEDKEDQLFGVGLELCILWVNRILFLKLLEAQLYRYHREDEKYKFMNYEKIDEFDELNNLFFRVLAVKEQDRESQMKGKYGHIPYLNSSLFDVSSIEDKTTRISGLGDKATMPVYNRTVLKNDKGKSEAGKELNTLEYLFRFLEAYDFSAEGKEEIQEENKKLINASVLGLIFEKINGYKDGSFYTPGFITEYMCKETLRKSVLDKFNRLYGWDCSEFDELHNKIHRENISLEEANQAVNAIQVCDPAVGSGHFLVSALNEFIAIKSELGIFCDENYQVFRNEKVHVENDELVVTYGDDQLFEYTVGGEWINDQYDRSVNSQTQRIQKALFEEKRQLIENSLFGVDINPNSVKICQLRLWIELLKHAYYTEDSSYQELEVLPNIDINIKQGNSLVSRFGLDVDLEKILDETEYTLEDYKIAVANYKETRDQQTKHELRSLIKEMKESFTVELEKLHPEREKLKELEAELYKEQTQQDMFGDDDEHGGSREIRVQKLEKEIAKQEEIVNELESATFFKQSFEWRFEFPEILEEDGEFTGFDVVIGNPPYVPSRSESITDSLKSYYNSEFSTTEYQLNTFGLFIELGIQLIRDNGSYSFIVPNYWLSTRYDKKLRNHVFVKNAANKIINVHSVFEDAVVETLLLFGEKVNQDLPKKINLLSIDEDFGENGIKGGLNNDLIYDFKDIRIIHEIDEFHELTFKRRLGLKGDKQLGDFFDFSFGLKPYQVGKGDPPQTKEDVEQKNFNSISKDTEDHKQFLKAKNVETLEIKGEIEYLKYGKHLAEPRSMDLFSGDRIVLGRIISGDRIKAIYLDDPILCNTDLITLKPQKSLNADKVRFLLGIIVSKLTKYYLISTNINLDRKAYPKINTKTLRDFPIPSFSQSIVNRISNVVEKAQNEDSQKSRYTAEIDRLVYKVYGLSEEEVQVVEENLN